MPTRFSPVMASAVVALCVFTGWVTWRAKALEQDLGSDARKVTIVGKSAPDFHLSALDGHTVSLSDFHGRKLAIVFWASWNNGSHPAMATLSNFYQMSHKADSDYDLVAVSVDENKPDAQSFATQTKLPFTVLLDSSQSVTKSFQVRIVPTVLVIDAAGKVTYGFAGYTQRQAFDLARELGVTYSPSMEFGAPNGRRRN